MDETARDAPETGPDPLEGDGSAPRGEADAYRRMFRSHERERARRSGWATAIADLLAAHVAPRSVVDVGCGLGFFLAAMSVRGAERLTGLDADWIAGHDTEIPRERYVLHDLEHPLPPVGRHDLAVCLEVAEHLSEARGPGLVADLTGLSDLVLFSAAIPGQGGRGHVNCRWQSYWAGLFAERGFAGYDPFRRHLAAVPGMAPWFAQNLLLFAREGAGLPASLLPHRIAPEAADMVSPHYHRRILGAKDRHFRAAVEQLHAAGLRYVPPAKRAAQGPA